MGKKLRRLVLVGGIVASLGLAAPASATTLCAGTQQTAGVCVGVSPGGPAYEDCVYVGSPPCIPVSVPGVDLDCGGWIRDEWFLACA